MRLLFLLACLSFGVYAHYVVLRDGHSLKQLKNASTQYIKKKQEQKQAKKLFLGSLLSGTMKMITHLSTLLSVVDVSTTIWDRFNNKPKQDLQPHHEEESEELEMVEHMEGKEEHVEEEGGR